MSNMLIGVHFTVDVPEERIEKIIGHPLTDANFESATGAVEEAVRDNLRDYIENHSPSEPDVEFLA